MNKNNKLYIDPAMFTKPPPNFKSMSRAQPFKPEVPPPPYTKNSSHRPSPSPTGIYSNNNDDDTNYYLMMLYRYHNSSNPPPSSHNQNSFPTPNMSKSFPPPNMSKSFPLPNMSKSFPLPPPNFSPRQPPLPVAPPPQKPPQPLPPPSLSPSVPMAMGNYHNRTSPIYNQSFPNIHHNFKRKYDGNEPQKKLQKKKKKPLSQVVPQRRDWTMEEAKKALDVERDSNKRSKRQGLIIKFPDLELNRDIVSNFHTSIDSVHFQQPSTARYCFVTLTESSDPETVINQLNKIPFGLGYLSAEFKKDREDEQNIKPSDIDPLTLYVGNLAQEITKDDMEKKYPRRKRIDIGYAKKMKYTRYAFVSFHTVDDAIEAFQNTHSSQMYSKSLIVRFRRLHGTVGMPGEPKQVTQRFEAENSFNSLENCSFTSENDKEINQWDIDISHWDSYNQDTKCKRLDTPTSEDEECEEMETKPPLLTKFKPGSLEVAFSLHKPRMIKGEKNIDEYEDNQYDYYNFDGDYIVNEDDGNTDNISHPQSSKNDYLQSSKNGYPQSSKNHYPQSSKNDYPQSSNNKYPQSSKNDFPQSSKNDYPQSSKNDYPQSSKNDYPESSKNDYQKYIQKNVPDGPGLETVLATIKKEKCNNSTITSVDTYDSLRKIEQGMKPGNKPISSSNKPRQYVKIKQEKQNDEIENKQEVDLNGLIPEKNNMCHQVVDSTSSNNRNANDTQLTKDCSTNNDGLSENTAEDETNDGLFNWMNMDYTSTVIKTEAIDSDQR